MLGFISVFLGGSVGASLRYLLSIFALGAGFSYEGTFVINVLGCLFLGFVTYIALKKEKDGQDLNRNLKLFLTTGVAGGFTTFSTFSYEAFMLFKSGHVQTGLAYMLSSLIVGLLATGLGIILAKNMFALGQSVAISKAMESPVKTYNLEEDKLVAQETADAGR